MTALISTGRRLPPSSRMYEQFQYSMVALRVSPLMFFTLRPPSDTRCTTCGLDAVRIVKAHAIRTHRSISRRGAWLRRSMRTGPSVRWRIVSVRALPRSIDRGLTLHRRKGTSAKEDATSEAVIYQVMSSPMQPYCTAPGSCEFI